MIKHKVNIRVSGRPVLKAGDMRLPRRVVRWLLGEFQQVYLITPGKTIESIEVKEVEDDE